MRHLILLSLVLCPAVFGLKVGETAPDFMLKGTDGKSYGLKVTLKQSRAAVVIFTSTKCPYSNAYNDRFRELFGDLGKLGAKTAFFAINPNDDESIDEIRAHAEKNQYPFPVLKDEKHKVADAFGADKTPETFLVGRDGKIIYHGRIDDDTEGKNIQHRDLLKAVNEYINGKKISVSETKAFGCSILKK